MTSPNLPQSASSRENKRKAAHYRSSSYNKRKYSKPKRESSDDQKEESKKGPLGDFDWGNLIAIAALLISIFNLIDAKIKPDIEIQTTAETYEQAPDSFSFIMRNESGRSTGPIRISLYVCDTQTDKLKTDENFLDFLPPPPTTPEINIRGREAYISLSEGLYPKSEIHVYMLIRPVMLTVWHDGKVQTIETGVRAGCI